MPKYIELLPCDWLIINLCYQAIEQVYLIKWQVSVCIYIFTVAIHIHFFVYIFSNIYASNTIVSFLDRKVCTNMAQSTVNTKEFFILIFGLHIAR